MTALQLCIKINLSDDTIFDILIFYTIVRMDIIHAKTIVTQLIDFCLSP